MNGIEALYDCYRDSTLEFQRAGWHKWYTPKEWVSDSIYKPGLLEEDWRTQSRETKLNNALKEITDVLETGDMPNFREILAKYIKEDL